MRRTQNGHIRNDTRDVSQRPGHSREPLWSRREGAAGNGLLAIGLPVCARPRRRRGRGDPAEGHHLTGPSTHHRYTVNLVPSCSTTGCEQPDQIGITVGTTAKAGSTCPAGNWVAPVTSSGVSSLNLTVAGSPADLHLNDPQGTVTKPLPGFFGAGAKLLVESDDFGVYQRVIAVFRHKKAWGLAHLPGLGERRLQRREAVPLPATGGRRREAEHHEHLEDDRPADLIGLIEPHRAQARTVTGDPLGCGGQWRGSHT